MSTPEPPTIDPAALARSLRAAGLDPSFAGFELTHLGRFSTDVWRLELDNGVELVVKKPFGEPRPGEHPDVERRFYRLMAGRRGLPIPQFVADLDGALVMEYRRLEPFSFETGATPDHAAAAIDSLADWHAAFWNAPPRAAWLPDLADGAVRETIQRHYDAAWTGHRKSLLQQVPEFADIGDALVGRLAGTLAPLGRPSTLIHGDAHAENLPMTGEGVWLLDWQDPQIANPGLDLAVFMTMSFPAGERSRAEAALLPRYVRRLESKGCDWPDVREGYRLGLLRRAARIVEIADPGFVSLPWVFRRSARAAVDHGVESLIR